MEGLFLTRFLSLVPSLRHTDAKIGDHRRSNSPLWQFISEVGNHPLLRRAEEAKIYRVVQIRKCPGQTDEEMATLAARAIYDLVEEELKYAESIVTSEVTFRDIQVNNELVLEVSVIMYIEESIDRVIRDRSKVTSSSKNTKGR